ncbi:MAG: hypothetical protein PHS02_04530 [Candidatus ainarchaeum sp.]|nr:hypothetical protein [Candidatus ainarchaeum sp.]
MRPVIVFSLLLLATAVHAFEASDYLYANETNASISREFFTLNHTVYSLINISGSPSFLVKADELMVDQSR